MKTAISIPDKLFRRAEMFSKKYKLSRSELYSKAIERFLNESPNAELSAAYDSAFADGDGESWAEAMENGLLAVAWKTK